MQLKIPLIILPFGKGIIIIIYKIGIYYFYIEERTLLDPSPKECTV